LGVITTNKEDHLCRTEQEYPGKCRFQNSKVKSKKSKVKSLPAVRHGKNSKVKSQNSKVKANLCSGTIKNFQKMPRSLYFLYMYCKLKHQNHFLK